MIVTRISLRCMLLILIVPFLNSRLLAQCDPNLKPSRNTDFPYIYRDGRCEGFYNSQVSTPNIQIMGLIQGRLNYSLTESEVVTLSPLFTLILLM